MKPLYWQNFLKILPKVIWNCLWMLCFGHYNNIIRIYKYVYFSAEFSLIPRSCTGLSACTGSEVQMRLQFQYCASDCQQEILKERYIREELEELRSGFHSVCCRMCGSAVLSPNRYRKLILLYICTNKFSQNFIDIES